jgi:hypothetical protein
MMGRGPFCRMVFWDRPGRTPAMIDLRYVESVLFAGPRPARRPSATDVAPWKAWASWRCWTEPRTRHRPRPIVRPRQHAACTSTRGANAATIRESPCRPRGSSCSGRQSSKRALTKRKLVNRLVKCSTRGCHV